MIQRNFFQNDLITINIATKKDFFYLDIYDYPNTNCIDRRLLGLKRISSNMQFTQEVIRIRLRQDRGITVRGWDDTGIAQDPDGLLIFRMLQNDCSVIEHYRDILEMYFDLSCGGFFFRAWIER